MTNVLSSGGEPEGPIAGDFDNCLCGRLLQRHSLRRRAGVLQRASGAQPVLVAVYSIGANVLSVQVFAHLVETYCGDRTSGVLPAFMGGAEYPPSWWLPVAIAIAALGLVLVVAAAALLEADGSRGCLALCGCPGPEGLGCRCSQN